MKEPRTHYLVQFAARHAGARFKTLNAASALWRAEALVDDALTLDRLKREAQLKDVWFGSRAGTYEIISYFSVGLVTCLEWHARSRLVDLMIHQPACITRSDLKNVADLALSQMVAEGATIPHLLAAATNVSHLRDYLKIFERLFDDLKIGINIQKEFRQTNTDVDLHRVGSDTSLFGILSHLFELRNRLVHEIDMSVLGHFSLRDMWTLEDAIAFGNAVVACIKLLETCITRHAPHDFPNRLLDDGSEEDEAEKIQQSIERLEKEITQKIAEFSDSNALWMEALKASQASRKLELDYLAEAQFLRPIRHLDRRRGVQIELLKTRLAFLLLIKSELDW